MKKHSITILFCLLFCFLHGIAQPGWQAISGAPTGQRFDDVSFINDSTGWIAQYGHIYKTTDRGLTWNELSPLLVGAYVRSILFLNDTLGFLTMLPATPALFTTHDGGNTFTRMDSSIANFTGICGMSHYGNTIIGVGTYNAHPSFYKSTDAGQTWAKTDLQAPGYFNSLVDCYMVDANNYLICGQAYDSASGKIMRTSDGGTNWQTVAVSSNSNYSWTWKIFFIANGVGFASTENATQGLIFKTMDYGNTWTEIIVNHPEARDFGAIGAINDSVIWVGRQDYTGIFGTTNGGSSWTYYPTFGQSMDRMRMLDSSNIICTGASVYKFTNGGPSSVSSAVYNGPYSSMKIKGNPVTDGKLHVDFTVFKSTLSVIYIIDAAGKPVKTVYNSPLESGITKLTFSVDDIKSGLYTLLFMCNEGLRTEKFEVIKK